ncbi:MAG: hypothetical protein R6V01_08850 [Thermoplasmatota archaeon]
MMEEEYIRSLDPFSIKREKGGIRLYEVLGCEGEVLYIGIGNLRVNLPQHLPTGWFPINEGRYYRRREIPPDQTLEMTKNGLISEYERENGTLPKYNRWNREFDIGESEELLSLI